MLDRSGSSAIAVATALGLAAAPAALADVQTVQFNIIELDLAIFGVQFSADYLGPPSGTIVETRADLTYTTGGNLDAADIVLSLQAPSEGVPVWQFSGADLGWSGSGTFHASLATDELNGLIDLGDPPPDFSLFLLVIAAEDFQPLAGQFIDSSFEVDIDDGSATKGDVDGNGTVDVADLVAVILAWGPCPAPPDPCAEDVDGDGSVGVNDLVAVILNWSAD